MPRTSQARVFRNNAAGGTIDDLTTAFGTTPNTATDAAMNLTGFQVIFVPGMTAPSAATPPAVGANATGKGWRDTVGENATEAVTYDAGTWTVRTRINKTVMTINASVTVRIIAVVYQVTSAGVHVAEIGRVQMADTNLPTVNATVTISGSFTTGTASAFAIGDKVQVEVYVQNIVAGLPAGAASGYTVAFVVDETSANSGASLTAIPGYQILFGRTYAATATATPAMARAISAFRTAATTVVGTAARRIALTPLPKAVTATATPATVKTITPLPKVVTALATSAIVKRVTPLPKAVTAVGTAAMARRITAARAFATTVTGVAGFARALIFGRQAAVGATAVVSGRVDIPLTALNRIIPAAAGDWPLNTPTTQISGVTRDSAGAALGGCTVKLIRVSDHVVVATTTSSGMGAYSFTRGAGDPHTYRVLADLAGSPQRHGVSDTGLVGV